VAFREAVRLMVPASSVPAAAAPQVGKPTGGTGIGGSGSRGLNGEDQINVSEDEMYNKIVDQTGVDRDKLVS
jgi:hypothetical protein